MLLQNSVSLTEDRRASPRTPGAFSLGGKWTSEEPNPDELCLWLRVILWGHGPHDPL